MRVRAAAGTAQCLVGIVMVVFAAAAFVPQAAQSSHRRRRDNLQWLRRWRIGRAALE